MNGDTGSAKFTQLKSYLDAFLGGDTVCVFTHGVTGKPLIYQTFIWLFIFFLNFIYKGSGKSSTMFGVKDDLGILQSSAVYILKHGEISVSVIEFTDKEVFDLSSGSKIHMDPNKLHPTTEVVYSSSEFGTLIQQATDLRLQKCTNQNQTSSRSHLIIVIKLKKGAQGEIIFADLAGFENANGKENIDETKYINSTLTDINTMLLNLSRGNVVNSNKYSLTRFLKPYLKPENKTIMLYHVTKSSLKTSLELVKDFVASTVLKPKERAPSSDKVKRGAVVNKSDPKAIKKLKLQSGRFHIR